MEDQKFNFVRNINKIEEEAICEFQFVCFFSNRI